MLTHNSAETERTFRRLRMLIRRLGRHGGSITPSIYETAQVLRFCPHHVNSEQVINWLLSRQQVDGGWENPDAPLYRTVPTLAAVLALHEQGHDSRARQARSAGLKFLTKQSDVIDPDSGQYLPVAIELILPRLLDEAEAAGLALPRARFHHILELNQQRLALLARHPPKPQSPPMFSWEAWGNDPAPELVGEMGGVGHSPAATAWWLHLDKRRPSTSAARERALTYLAAASQAGGAGISGVVPGPWPMNRFEQSFVLHMIVMAGLSGRHELAAALLPQAIDLQQLLARGGVGFSDHFAADGDDTAAAVAVMAATGLQVDGSLLLPFQRADHFVAYPFELHVAHTVTARATQALALLGQDVTPWRSCIVQSQQADGWWSSEKWNRSRLYGTAVAIAGLADGPCATKTAAAHTFLQRQHEDGGWGCFGHSTAVETAFGILALCRIAQSSGYPREVSQALGAAQQYLRSHDNIHQSSAQHMWISKDLYCARRIDQAVILSAMLVAQLRPQTVLPSAPRSAPRSTPRSTPNGALHQAVR